MGVWCIVLLSVIVGVVANEHPPSNPPYLAEELDATAESRTLTRGQDQEHKVERLPEVTRVMMNEMIKTVNESFTQRVMSLEQKLEQLKQGTEVYFMQPDPSNNIKFEVSRDWTNNHGLDSGWIVFQRRLSGMVNFYRNWTDYKNGFGYLRGEHWLGLDKLYAIIKTRRHELLIVLEDFNGMTKCAHYDDFKIGDESEKYVLKSVGKYTGTAGDAFTYQKDSKFSTYDQDNDDYSSNCAEKYKGGWWFRDCHESHLNGEYLFGKTYEESVGVHWPYFRERYSLKSSKMMVRPFE